MASLRLRRTTRCGRWTVVAALTVAFCGWGLGAGCSAGGSSTDDDDGGGASGNAGGGSTTSTTSTTTTATGSTTSSTASGTGGAPCDADPCKLTPPQCGCGYDEKCTVGYDGPECVQDGTIDGGQQCLGTGCKAGYICSDFVDPPETCHQFCDSDADCQAPGGACVLSLTITGSSEYTVTLCSEDCDPITSAGCPVPGMRCDALRDDGPPERFFTMCVPAGSAAQEQACSGIADCAPGLSCFTVDSDKMCLTWCDVASPQCPTGTCRSTDPPTLVGSTEYGVCF